MDVQNRLNNALLCPTNKDALEINEVILLRLQGDNHEYLSTTEILNRDDELVADIDDYPIEEAFLSTPQSFPPPILNIKVGAIVMLIKNWNVCFGLCN
ncbi:ATP-dependent DNA helicase PIF1-like, partial [Brachionus plicatilis]